MTTPAQPKRGRGRPPKPPGETLDPAFTRVTAAERERLEREHGSVYAGLRALVKEWMQRKDNLTAKAKKRIVT